MTPVTIIGAGAFGTALAISLARDGRPVTLVARTPDLAERMRLDRENTRRLPGVALPDGVEPTHLVPKDPGTVLLAMPMQTLGSYLREFRAPLGRSRLVACCKGVDLATGLGPVGTISKVCPKAHAAILSGPSFADDIARGLPTALTLAAHDDALARALQAELSTSNLRLYSSTDVTGVELGGALKNVIAIAAGITIGAGLGQSARAALMTRGYAELTRFARAAGALPETLAGLSGFGDLVLTCTSDKSRNFSYGVGLGRGGPLSTGATVEGIETAKAVSKLAKSADIDMPVTNMVAHVVLGEMTVEQAVQALMSRPLRRE